MYLQKNHNYLNILKNYINKKLNKEYLGDFRKGDSWDVNHNWLWCIYCLSKNANSQRYELHGGLMLDSSM